jgi:soluble lytic murein transglycosylase-like protein
MLLFVSATVTYDLPPGLLSALCWTESKHDIHAIHHDDGNSDSLGICQIKLKTARMMGFKGTAEDLMDPKENISYAAKYLKAQLRRYSLDSPKAVAAYNLGTFRKGSTRFASNQKYVDKVFMAWAARK